MRFGGKVDDGVRLEFIDDGFDLAGVADIGLDKPVTRLLGQTLQAVKVAGVGQFVQVQHLYIRLLHQ